MSGTGGNSVLIFSAWKLLRREGGGVAAGVDGRRWLITLSLYEEGRL
jgi:hypothetical protein